MDQDSNFCSLTNRLKEILSSEPFTSSNTVLPPSIPTSLPSTVTLLPDCPTSNPLDHLTTLLNQHVLPYLNLSSLSPNYYGFVTGGVTPAALLADWLVSVYDQNLSVHLPSESIATNIEVAALDLLVQLFNLPEEWRIGSGNGRGSGTFTTGATASNVLGLALGREWVVREAARRKVEEKENVGKDTDGGAGGGGGGGINDDLNETASIGRQGLLQACLHAGITNIQILSTLPHSSIAKAASVVGIGRDNVISLAQSPPSTTTNGHVGGYNDDEDDTDIPLHIDVLKFESLARTMTADRKAYILAVSAGEVNTGQFATDGYETMKKLRDICDEYGIWMHVDGAFGLFGRILASPSPSSSFAAATTAAAAIANNATSSTPQPPAPHINRSHSTSSAVAAATSSPHKEDYTHIINGTSGLHLADSITSDAHKLLNVPYDCGIFFTRHRSLGKCVFSNGNAAYLNPTTSSTTTTTINTATAPTTIETPKPNNPSSPMNNGIENSRRFRALPVWSTLLTYGRAGHVDMLTRQITLARRIVEWMWDVDGLEVLPKSSGSHSTTRCTTSSSSVAAAAAEDKKDGKGKDRAKQEAIHKTFIIVLFRARDEGLNEMLVKEINRTGRMYVTGTKWGGKKACRIAVSNWRVDVERDFEIVKGVIGGVVGV